MVEKAVRKTAAKKTTRKTVAPKAATAPLTRAPRRTTTKKTTVTRSDNQSVRRTTSTVRKAPSTVSTPSNVGRNIRLAAATFLMVMVMTSVAIGVSDNGVISVAGTSASVVSVPGAQEGGLQRTLLPGRQQEQASVNGGLVPAHAATAAPVTAAATTSAAATVTSTASSSAPTAASTSTATSTASSTHS